MTNTAEHGTSTFPEPGTAAPATSLPDCDVAVADLREQAHSWFAVRPDELVAILERVNDAVLAAADDWVAKACAAKHTATTEPLAGEEWQTVAIVARYVRLLIRSLVDIAAGRKPQFPDRPHTVSGGHMALPVFPVDTTDKIAFSGFSAEVWLRRGLTVNTAVDGQAAAWFGDGEPGVSLVLGAGNFASIPLLDCLYRLVVDRHPVVLKLNPVNDYLGPVFEQVLAEVIERGVVRVVYGGSEVGSYLVRHDGVDDVHVTGSDKTFYAIVFGTGEDGEHHRLAHEPVVTKPVTGELSNVSPCLVVPGEWSAKDLAFQAENIVSMVTNNAGFNCVCLRVLVTASDWAQRSDLLAAVGGVLRQAPTRFPYYPGARDRYDQFLAVHPEAERFGGDDDGAVPWTMIPGLRPDATDEIAFTTESFNGVFGEVGIEATGTVDYIRRAVAFANDGLWGTLGCTLIVSPKSMADPEVHRAVEQAIADLRYGTVVVNHWSAIGFMLGSTPWGAYPGHSIDDIQSGVGFVHNAMMLRDGDIEKAVVRGPFRLPYKPNWFVTNAHAQTSGERFARMSAKPSWAKLPGLISASVRG